MPKRYFVFVLLFIGGGDLVYGDQMPVDSLSDCVEDLILPIDGLLARAAGGSSGPIAVTIHIGEGGRLVSTQFDSGKELFQKQVIQAMNLSKFSASCAGKTVRFVFSFEIEGVPADNPGVWYSFKSPNRFTLHTHPRATEVLRTKKPH